MKEYEKVFFFDNVKECDFLNLSISKEGNGYRLTIHRNISPNLFYYNDNGRYYYSFNETNLANVVSKIGGSLTENDNWYWYHNINKVKDKNALYHNQYNEIHRITLFKSVTIRDNGYDVDYIEPLFSIPIEKCGQLVDKWISQYKTLCKEKCSDIIPELSSGLDTRSLTYFWRDLPIKDVYTKNDKDEVPIVEVLLPIISTANLCIGNKPKYKYTLSGKGGDLFAVKPRFCDVNFLVNHTCQFKSKHLIEYITPYLDRELLRIKPNFLTELKIVLQYLLARDLMCIPYKSFARREFTFDENTERIANKILSFWNIDKKVHN